MKRPKRDWSQVVRDQAASGKSVQEYCESIGIHPNTFYKKRKVHELPAMVEILPRANKESTPIVVSVEQYSVAIRNGFDAQSLKSVLQVIGELQ